MRYRVGTAVERWCTERTACGAGMMRRWSLHLRIVTTATVVSAALACGGSAGDAPIERARDATATVTRAAGATAAASSGVAGSKPICPATGAWQTCSVVERLERAGLAPRRESGQIREPPLSSPGIALALGRSELRVFVYEDRAARERDQARLDAKRYSSASEPLSMQAAPTLIASENLLVILRSRSDHQRERVSDALTAGPPQIPGTKE